MYAVEEGLEDIFMKSNTLVTLEGKAIESELCDQCPSVYIIDYFNPNTTSMLSEKHTL